MISLQRQFSSSEKKKIFEYHNSSQLSTSYFICLTKHSTEVAYKHYHWKHLYIKEFIDIMIPPEDVGHNSSNIGAKRIAEYLAWRHRETFIDVANEKAIAVCGVMDEIESAAMYRDAGLRDSQAHIILKHLR